MAVGENILRVDAYDKVTGRANYTDDLLYKNTLVIKIVHSTIAHGMVKNIDSSEALKIQGVVRVITCFEVPDIQFPTAGHPWALDSKSQDVADRHILNKHVRYYGDDIAVVIAENELAAIKGVNAIKVEYDEYPVLLSTEEAIKEGSPLIHDEYSQNILAHTSIRQGNYEEAIKDPGLIKVEGWYETPIVHHCHLENFICFSYMENERITVVTSTQIPHIVRRIVGQALNISWGKVRIIKPYIGGGFGNKQDDVRAAYGAAGPVPLRAYNAEKLIKGKEVIIDLVDEFAKTATDNLNPRSSWRAGREFRMHILEEMSKRCLVESIIKCGGAL